MAEISFFMTEEEIYTFIQFCIDQFEARFFPEKNLEREFPFFSKIADIKNRIEVSGYKRYFIVSKYWGEHALKFEELNIKDHHYYYVKQRYGGPAFDLSFPRIFEEEGLRWIVPGMLSDYTSYYIGKNGENILKRPLSMAHAYKKMSQYIKKGSYHSICEEKNFKGPLITPEAFREYQKGTWLRIGDNHFNPIEKTK